LRKAANKAFHKAYKSKLEQDWQAHRAARRAFKELCRSKRESLQDFCAKTEGMSEISRVYKLLDKANTVPLGMLKLPSGQWTNTLEEAYKHLLETHFPGCKLASNINNCSTFVPVSSVRTKWVPSSNWHVASTVVTLDRISWAIKTMAPFKSPGIGIYPILLQKGLQHLLDLLSDIYGASLALGYIPQIWRTSRVTFMLKPGKMEYTIAKSYRPISLTSFLLKGLEKLVDRYLRSGPLVYVPIHPRQHAFQADQAGKSTESALHQLVGRIEKVFDAKEHSLGVFLARDVIYASSAYATMSVSVCLSVCL